MCYNPDEGEDELDNLTSTQEASLVQALIRILLKEYPLPFLDSKLGRACFPRIALRVINLGKTFTYCIIHNRKQKCVERLSAVL